MEASEAAAESRPTEARFRRLAGGVRGLCGVMRAPVAQVRFGPRCWDLQYITPDQKHWKNYFYFFLVDL